jgi:putative membrane protein
MLSVVRRSNRPAFVLALPVLAMFAVSCGTKEQAQQREGTTSPATTSQPAPAMALTDANIVAIVVAANSIDIKNGQMANSKSNNNAVKAFATQMIIDHTGVNKKATDLVTTLNVTPKGNAVSHKLVENADATRDGIKAKEGADFDKAYIDNEVAYHQAVIDMLDKTLIPGATNAELKTLLEGVRPAFEAHLEHAKHIQAALSK